MSGEEREPAGVPKGPTRGRGLVVSRRDHSSGDRRGTRNEEPTEKRPRGTARDRALNLLSFRDRSRRELERRLRQAGFEDDDVAEALDGLARAGVVDDARFARAVVEQEAGRRLSGRRVVESALLAKGVDRESARAALAELDDPVAERARAEELARSRARRMAGLSPDVAYRRLVGLLARRGYAPPLCRDAARRALAIDPVDDSA